MGALTADEAGLLLAILMSGSDGRMQKKERRLLVDHLMERRPDIRLVEMENKVELLAGETAGDRARLLLSLREALPDAARRHDALVLALQIANADRRLRPAEVENAIAMADALGMSQSDFSRALDAAIGMR